jgi:DNA-binding response OmpR family regulator
MQILLVENDRDILDLMSAVLGKMGHIVESASTADAALSTLGNKSFDLLISNLSMPGVSGVEVIRHLRANSPETRIIAITDGGNDLPEELLKEEAGAEISAFLKKPFTLTELAESIEAAVQA